MTKKLFHCNVEQKRDIHFSTHFPSLTKHSGEKRQVIRDDDTKAVGINFISAWMTTVNDRIDNSRRVVRYVK